VTCANKKNKNDNDVVDQEEFFNNHYVVKTLEMARHFPVYSPDYAED